MRTPFLLAAVVLLSGGCGPDCQTSCEKIFGDGPDQCNVEVPGKPGQEGATEMTHDCVAHCEHALARNGEVGAYNPNERASGNEEISLDNEQQAAVWMDCIDQTSCDFIKDNVCAPVYNFP